MRTTGSRRGLTCRLFERVAAAGPHLRIDEANSCLRGVRLLGLVSGNGRRYAPEGVRAACHLYEGRPCYVNHRASTRGVRPVEDKVGWFENVRPAADGGLTADLHLLKSHPMSARLFEGARRRPELFQLSHDAVGRERAGSRGSVIEGIVSVASVDVVAEGATVSSLFESGYRPPGPAATPSTSQQCAAAYRRAEELGLMEAPPPRTPRQEYGDEARRRRVLAARQRSTAAAAVALREGLGQVGAARAAAQREARGQAAPDPAGDDARAARVWAARQLR
jgi:hypothetical protein